MPPVRIRAAQRRSRSVEESIMATLLVVSDLAEPASIGRGGLSMYALQWLHRLERLGHRGVFLEFLEKDAQDNTRAPGRDFRAKIVIWWDPRSPALHLGPNGGS